MINPQTLSVEEAFYFASLLHLWLARIHPLRGWQWRLARLVESWFLAQHLGEVAWRIQSAYAYYRRRGSYYQHLNLDSTYGSLGRQELSCFCSCCLSHCGKKVSWVMNGEADWLD